MSVLLKFEAWLKKDQVRNDLSNFSVFYIVIASVFESVIKYFLEKLDT